MKTPADNANPVPDCLEILYFYYPEDTPLRRLLLRHSAQVRDKALALVPDGEKELVASCCMLHDIGIGECHAPDILCTGTKPYLAHGLAGGAMIREYARRHQLDLECFARVCERHTGTGITEEEIRRKKLPLPEQDWLPETRVEKLVCYADKFFSKSGSMREKSLEHIRAGLAKFGPDTLARFEELHRLFGRQTCNT